MAEWNKVKAEYINGYISQRKLAEKHGIPYQTLRDRAIKEKWNDRRKAQRAKIGEKTEQKAAEILAEREANRLLRISDAADRLLAKIEEATEQLDQFIVTNRVKQKEVKYVTSKAGFGKPQKEIVKEIEDKRVIKATHLDRMGLKQLASALKDLKDIQFTDKEEAPQEDTTVNIIFEAATPEDIESDEED